MAIEHFLNDIKLIGVIDTLIVNEDTEAPIGSRLTVEELTQLNNTTEEEIIRILSELQDYNLLLLENCNGETFCSLNNTPIANKLRELEDLVNLYQSKREMVK
jgi:2,4-dienoyl-CoA reductase-like NADH-dependent reductase (Old Yellow Enzyme family)